MYQCFQCELVEMAQVKTRAKSTSHLSNLVGTRRELLVSELPTVRDILRYGIYLRDQSKDDRRNYPVDQLVGDIFPGLIGQWSKANALFKPPVINEKVTIMSKLKEVWNQAVKFSLGKGKLDAKERFSVKLDQLFDILTCKCRITSCEGGGCDGCAGIITEDNTSKVIDKNKVKRAQEKLMRELGEEFEEKCREMGGSPASSLMGGLT